MWECEECCVQVVEEKTNSVVSDVRFPCSGKACAGAAGHERSNGPSPL